MIAALGKVSRLGLIIYRTSDCLILETSGGLHILSKISRGVNSSHEQTLPSSSNNLFAYYLQLIYSDNPEYLTEYTVNQSKIAMAVDEQTYVFEKSHDIAFGRSLLLEKESGCYPQDPANAGVFASFFAPSVA